MDRTDIVARLRCYDQCNDSDIDEAADEIERLRRECERLIHLVRDQQCTNVQDKMIKETARYNQAYPQDQSER